VAERLDIVYKLGGEVFVEFEFHVDLSGMSCSSWANSAA
jgi:hypothetical protein